MTFNWEKYFSWIYKKHMKLGLILGSVSVVTLGVGAGLVTSISAYSNLEEFIRKIPATTTVSDLSFTKEQIDSEAYTKDLKQQKLDYRKISDLQVEMSYWYTAEYFVADLCNAICIDEYLDGLITGVEFKYVQYNPRECTLAYDYVLTTNSYGSEEHRSVYIPDTSSANSWDNQFALPLTINSRQSSGEEIYRIYINNSHATTDLNKKTGAGEWQDDGKNTTFNPFVINAVKGGDSYNFFDYLNLGWSLANIQFK